MSLTRLWTFLAIALPVLAALIANVSAVDLTYHLRAGGEILDTRAIPAVDTWTFTAVGQPWYDQQWGAQAVLALVSRLFGWTGLVILRAALTGFVFGVVALIARRRGLDARLAALLTLAAFAVAAPALALRPQLFGMACFALVLLLLTDRRAHPGRVWAIPVVVVLWANLHGSFFLGPVVLGLAWLEDLHDHAPLARRTLATALVSAAAACLTPAGPWVWSYAVGLSLNPAVTSRITEWQPTSLRDVPGILFFASALAVATLLARRGRATPWPTLAWFAVFFAIGAYAVRGVAWWPIAAAIGIVELIAVPAGTARPERTEPPFIRRMNVVVVALLVLVSVALLPVWRPLERGLDTPLAVVGNAPPGITGELRTIAQPGDRLFNPQPWGSWFEYALPALPVVLDSRIELFQPDVWDAYQLVASGGDGWQAQLQRWGVTIVVVAGDGDAAFAARLTEAGWRHVYTDSDGQVFLSAGHS